VAGDGSWERIAVGRAWYLGGDKAKGQEHKQRDKAEALFTKALTKNPGELWHWVGAGGSYLSVKPQ
jgi:hypothetical protein